MKYISKIREKFNDGVRYVGNKASDGLGDLLTTPVDGVGLIALWSFLVLAGCTANRSVSPSAYSSHYLEGQIVDSRLRVVAGLYAGTVTAKKTVKDGKSTVIMNGYYSEMQRPEAMARAREHADVNGDGTVTSDEALDLLSSITNSLSDGHSGPLPQW